MKNILLGTRVQEFGVQYDNVRLPGAQNFAEKCRIINGCDKKIKEMRDLLKNSRLSDAKRIRVEEIIRNQREMKAREISRLSPEQKESFLNRCARQR